MKYQTNNIMALTFMSPKTFISWLFGWLVAFKIDFRKSIDPWCKYSPQIIAGDGTHIGVSVCIMNLENPVTCADDPRCLKPTHKCNTRLLLPKRIHREHLRYLILKMLKKLPHNEGMDMDEEATKTNQMVVFATTVCGQEAISFLLAFAQKTEEEEVLRCMACILYMMSGDSALSSVVPFDCHDLLISTYEDIKANVQVDRKLEELKYFCIEISELLKFSLIHDANDMIVAFVQYLVQQFTTVHSNRIPPDPEPIPNSYNPSQGTTYYLTESDNQLRRMPSYDIEGRGRNNYDDRAEVEDPCTKNYPSVSFGGLDIYFFGSAQFLGMLMVVI